MCLGLFTLTHISIISTIIVNPSHWYFRLDIKGKDIRQEPKGLVFLSKLLILFRFCHFCFETSPKLVVTQTGTMISIESTCQKCIQTYKWTSQPLLLSFPAGNLLLSFAILTAGASVRKILLVLRHINVLVYNECSYYYHQKNPNYC